MTDLTQKENEQLKRPESFLKTLGSLWRQFLPLSLSDVTMAAGDPLVTTTLAYLPDARTNIAAVGIAKSLAVLFESPIIMLLHTSNALAPSKKARELLLKFTLILCGFLTALLVFLGLEPIFQFVSSHVLHIDPLLTERSRLVLWILFLWPASIACRRYFQGLLIRTGHNKAVARAGLARLATVSIVLAVGYWFFTNLKATQNASLPLAGSILAGAALIIGIITETFFVIRYAWIYFHQTPLSSKTVETLPMNYKEVWTFYWPLANSMLVVWGGRVILVAIIARAVDSSLALSAWPAAWGFVLVVANATRMVQQVIIRNHGSIPNRTLLLFAASVGMTCSILLLSLSVTPIGKSVLAAFVGHDEYLLSGIRPVVLLCSGFPFLIAMQNAFSGLLIVQTQTKRINVATWIGTFVLLVSASISVKLSMPGATAAAGAMALALLGETLWLALGVRQNSTAVERILPDRKLLPSKSLIR